MFLNTDSQQAYEINQILIGNLRINFISIILTDGEESVEGNGFLYQTDDKELKIVFFRKTILEEFQELEYFFKKGEAKGGLRKPTCHIKAIDNNKVSYSGISHFNPRFSQNVEEFKIHKLTSDKTGHINRVVFRGKYKIPTNSKYTTISTYKPYKESIVFNADKKIDSIDNSFEQRACEKREMWKIKLPESTELNLCQFEDYLELLILSNHVLDEGLLEKIVHSLDFVLGNKTQLVYYSIKELGTCFFSSNKMYSSGASLEPPLIQCQENKKGNCHSELYKSYFNYIKNVEKEKYQKLLKSHRKIVAASRLYSFNFGQSLAIQIEYLAATFLKDYKVKLIDDSNFKNDVKGLIDYIKKDYETKHNESKEWIINRLKPGTSKEKWSKAKLIGQLIKDKAVYGEYDSWNELRNDAAHGSDKNSKHEKLIERIFDCTEIYYTMLFYIIGYEGNYTKLRVDNYAEDKVYKLPQSS
ncbi:MAG: hypothetical protein KAT68_10965 [Bacteroidales bacterium]|nr:hypothetical protein [Bacteroidales bacterium]